MLYVGTAACDTQLCRLLYVHVHIVKVHMYTSTSSHNECVLRTSIHLPTFTLARVLYTHGRRCNCKFSVVFPRFMRSFFFFYPRDPFRKSHSVVVGTLRDGILTFFSLAPFAIRAAVLAGCTLNNTNGILYVSTWCSKWYTVHFFFFTPFLFVTV